jgi:hypothetical protein
MSMTAAVVGPATLLGGPVAIAHASGPFSPGNLLVSTSVWTTDAPITAGTTPLPPGCTGSGCTAAIAGGAYPQVFNNAAIDSSFGVTEPIVLDQVNPSTGTVTGTLTVPNSSQTGVTSSSDQMVTSFSSKSELALNLSTADNYVTFMGYVAPVGSLDVSNANTPGVVDSTNPVTGSNYRAAAQLDTNGNFQFTETNAYSGNNPRAAILNEANNSFYTAGNAGNGSNPEPQGVVDGAGSQIFADSGQPESAQTVGQPTPLGNFNAYTELGITADTKSAKDNNFRGLTLDNNVIYYTKGSGSNGVDTVYFVDTVGGACPTGSGLPATGAALPSASTFVSPTFSTSPSPLSASNPGLLPTNMCVLNGFPTASAKNATDASDYPFGIWFANPTTLYVADEGAGDATYSATTNTYTAAAASTTAGLQKWSFSSSLNKWVLDYTLQNGLSLGQPYSVANSGTNSYPTGNNSYTTTKGTTTGPWAPANDGLRNLTGEVNSNGTVTLWATTSTVSYSGDQGADPNSLVSITDNLGATTLPTAESFSTVMVPTWGQVVRGVSFTPGTGAVSTALPEVPWAPLIPISAVAVGGVMWQLNRRRGLRAA